MKHIIALACLALAIGACSSNNGPDVSGTSSSPLHTESVGSPTFLEACSTDASCSAGEVCFPFRENGPHCTLACETAADCPSPSTGCGTHHFCRIGTKTKTK